MKPYIQKLYNELMAQRPDLESLLDILFAGYAEANPLNVPCIRQDFADLNTVLRQLSLEDCDQVWNLTCKLCWEHQRDGYLEGVRTGIRLAAELAE